ncbi:MAG TPA: hypothetical protein VIK72_19070 [Clostridiaceae bacterium]
MLDLSKYKDRILMKKVIPRRNGIYSDFPDKLLPEIKKYLTEEGRISKLYSHQAEMFNEAIKGENIVITTSTASGKTYCYR